MMRHLQRICMGTAVMLGVWWLWRKWPSMGGEQFVPLTPERMSMLHYDKRGWEG